MYIHICIYIYIHTMTIDQIMPKWGRGFTNAFSSNVITVDRNIFLIKEGYKLEEEALASL